MKICVIIPAHNESRAIAGVVSAVCQKGLPVLVIDDGSVDGTGDRARQAGAEVLRNEHKSGKGASLQRGFEEVLRRGYDAVIAMDGDGQHAAADLDHFTAQAQITPVSIVTGSRMAAPQGMPLVRFWTNHVMSWLVSRLCGQTVPDTQCGYRYIHAEILRKLSLSSSDYEIETEVLVQAGRQGYPIISVPVQTIYSQEVSKINPVKDSWRFFRYLWRERRCRPRQRS